MGTRFWTMDGDRTKPFTGLAKALLFFALALIFLAFVTGCANVTVVKLAELCHANEGHPNTVFTGDTGRVECK